MKMILAFLSVLTISYTAQAADIEVTGVTCKLVEKTDGKLTDEDGGTMMQLGEFAVFARLDQSTKVVTTEVVHEESQRTIDKVEWPAENACDDHARSGKRSDKESEFALIVDGLFRSGNKIYSYTCIPRCKSQDND